MAAAGPVTGAAGELSAGPGLPVTCSASWPALDRGARHELPAVTGAAARSAGPRSTAPGAGLLAVHYFPAGPRYGRSAAPGAVTGATAIAGAAGRDRHGLRGRLDGRGSPRPRRADLPSRRPVSGSRQEHVPGRARGASRRRAP